LPGPNTLSPGGRVYLAFALVLFLLHATLLLAAPHYAAAPLLSNLIQIACPILAGFACLSAARQSK
jgi:hypothetical protein